MVACARALHDVEVVIREQDLRWAGCVLFMNFNKRVNAVSIVRLGQVPVEVILPEDARIAFVRKDEGVRKHLVVNDWGVAHDVVVLDESDSPLGPPPH